MALSRRDLLKASAVALAGCGVVAQSPSTGTSPTGENPKNETPGGETPGGETPGGNTGTTGTTGETGATGPTGPQPKLDVSTLPQSPAFPLGVGSGDVLPGAAILWSKTSATEPLKVRVWTEKAPTTFAFAAGVTAKDGFLSVEAKNLQPNTTYYYAFTIDDKARSPIGRFKTAPPLDSLDVVIFGGSCCTRYSRAAPFPTLSDAATHDDLAFFVHGGDRVYCDGAVSLAQYRNKYAQTYAEKGMLELNGAHAVFSTWDDHEIDNNFNPESGDANQIAAARTAFFEHSGLRKDASDPNRIWRSARFGKTLELFILDARGERKPSTRLGPDPIYLSRAQMDWLKASLTASPAKFKFIVNQVPISIFGGAFAFAANDRWEGYAAQRTEILSHISSEAIAGVWWLSGDFHFGAVGGTDGVREILWGPGGNTPNVLYPLVDPAAFPFTTGESTYTVLKADPVKNELTIEFIDGAGDVIYAQKYANT